MSDSHSSLSALLRAGNVSSEWGNSFLVSDEKRPIITMINDVSEE